MHITAFAGKVEAENRQNGTSFGVTVVAFCKKSIILQVASRKYQYLIVT